MRNFWRRFRRRRAGLVSAAFLLLLMLAAVAAPLLLAADPNEITDDVLKSPSLLHVMGTDDIGRDILTGVIYGIRVSLAVGVLAAFAATVIGGVVGALAGFVGGALDLVVMRVSEFFQVVPTFILAALIIALSGPGLTQVVAVIALLAWPQTARLMRGEVLRIKRLEFVDALRCLGVGEAEILAREVVPNALAPMLAVGTLIVGQAILLEAALGFFGLSSPDVVSWGRMLNSGQRFLFNAWWISLFSGMAIFLTVLAFNLLGDALSDAMNPRLEV